MFAQLNSASYPQWDLNSVVAYRLWEQGLVWLIGVVHCGSGRLLAQAVETQTGDSKLICSANFMTWPIPAILCRPSYFIAFYCIAFYCWTGQLRCKSSLSDIIIIIIHCCSGIDLQVVHAVSTRGPGRGVENT